MDRLLAALRAAGERSRLRLLALLRSNELAVTELSRILGQSQPRVSRHLKLLGEAGLLERFQEGSWVFYRLAESGDNAELATVITSLIPPGDPELERDLERLAAIKRERADHAARYFRDMASRWDEFRSLYVEESAVEAAMLEACGDLSRDGAKGDFLDLGTGTGRLLELFAPHFERGLGIDLSREMLSVARSNLEDQGLANCRVRQGDVYHLEADSNSFDLVTIHHVLHYLDRPMDAISEAARVLRPGGRLLVVDFGPHEIENLRTHHAHRRLGFTDAEIESGFELAGFHDVEIRHLANGTSSRDIALVTALWTADLPHDNTLHFPDRGRTKGVESNERR